METASTVPTSRLESWRRAALVAGRSLELAANVLGNVERLVSDLLCDSVALGREAAALAPYVYAGAVDAQRVVVATPRLARILRDVGAVVLDYRLARLRTQAASPAEAARVMAAVHERSAERMYTLCAELGGGLVKLGQLASTRADILPHAWVAQLSRLQDSAPPVPAEDIVARIEEELGVPVAERFADFDTTPLATASLAQVHAARLHDGREVVVKVRIPGVETRILTDLLAIRVIARWIDDMVRGADLVTVAEELTRSVVAELDYGAEADAADGFRERFADEPRLVIPRVVRELSTACVLTLERLRGERLTARLDAAESEGAAGEGVVDEVLRALIEFYGVSILRHGEFHSDPHPGNFLVLPDGRVAILDFGSVTTQDRAVRAGYGRLVAAMMQGDARAMAAGLEALGFEGEPDRPEALEAFAAQLRDAVLADLMGSLSDLDPAEQLAKTMSLAQDSPIQRIPADFVMVGRVLVALSGFVMRYRPRLSLPALLLPLLAEALESA